LTPHHIHRTDKGQKQIVEALRAAGATVVPLTSPPGIPDLLVGWGGQGGRCLLLEVKAPAGPDGGASKRGQKLNEVQERFHAHWKGPIFVVRSPEEALQVVFG
jgi:hypothetical protein